MAAPLVKYDAEKKHYSVRLDSGLSRIRAIIPNGQFAGAKDEASKQKAALKKAKALAKELYDAIQAD